MNSQQGTMYNSVLPLSQRTNGQYLPNDTVDFVMDFAGKEIDPSSIRISGNLMVTKNNGTAIDGTEQVYIDPAIGAHALFQQYITSLPDSGVVVENFMFVPRWVAMEASATKTRISTGSELKNVCELRCPTQWQTTSLIASQAGVKPNGASFSIKPVCALTRALNNISYSRTGQVKLTCFLSSVQQLLFGAAVDATYSYYLTDLQLDYVTYQDTNQPLIMSRISSLKQTLSSSNQQLSLILPISSSSLTLSFISLEAETQLTSQFTALQEVPQVSMIEFAINDIVSGSFITYALEDKPEITLNALMSMGQSEYGRYNLAQTLLDREKLLPSNYLVGTLFGSVPLTKNTKVGINIQSAVQQNTAMACYLYFKGLYEL